jgi:hypothetical protein
MKEIRLEAFRQRETAFWCERERSSRCIAHSGVADLMRVGRVGSVICRALVEASEDGYAVKTGWYSVDFIPAPDIRDGDFCTLF